MRREGRLLAPRQGSESQTLQTYLLPSDGPVSLISVHGDRERQCLLVEIIRIGSAPVVSVSSQKYALELGEAEDFLAEIEKAVNALKDCGHSME